MHKGVQRQMFIFKEPTESHTHAYVNFQRSKLEIQIEWFPFVYYCSHLVLECL